MTAQEFSSSFDTLLDSYAHQATFGKDASEADLRFDEYEKSVFLTKAQEEVALALYNGRNSSLEGFEETEELRRYLSNLICEAELDPVESSNGKPIGLNSKSKFFTLPDGTAPESEEGEEPITTLPAVWFITYEAVIISDGKCENTTSMEVVPVRQDEYHRIKNNPFRGANSHRSLRLDLSEGMVEIISEYTVTKYYIRYLRKLNPIIVAPLDDQSIDGISTVTECELPDYLHQRILERAVNLAIQRGKINNENK